eukprot:g5471.t1 g5471   contig2:599267-600317(+)
MSLDTHSQPKKLGGEVGGITLWPLGGFAVCGPTESLSGDLKVALAGPMTHIPMAIIWWGIYLGVSGGKDGLWPTWTIYLDVLSESFAGFINILSTESFYMNIILLCFNLFIPAYPLDGGRIYAASLILLFKMNPIKAAKTTAITAMLLSSGMILYAIISFLKSTGGSGLLLGVVGAFVLYNSSELFKSAKTIHWKDILSLEENAIKMQGGIPRRMRLETFLLSLIRLRWRERINAEHIIHSRRRQLLICTCISFISL